MRNIQRHGIALVLAVILLFGVMSVGVSADYFSPDYTDTADNAAILALARAGIMIGVGAHQFDPDAVADRATAITVLGRMAMVEPDPTGAESFTDVPNTWYTGYVGWAVSEGIVQGDGAGHFMPRDPVTQEQMALMLQRYAQSIGVAYTAPQTAATPLTRGGLAEMVYVLYEQLSPTVAVTGGTIRGAFAVTGVQRFLGIPYAADTSGENRFRAPQPVEAWEGVRACTEYGDIAMQSEASTFGGMMPWTAEYLDLGKTVESGEMSEDCLNLNVWTTAQAGEKRPVIVYIHGGANTSGSGTCEIYTGEDIAQKGVVYVSINYRVGIFGFLAYKDATGEEVTGNFAILDPIAALQWVQENIAAFGGDPDNVTIVGQSAGSYNVQTLITSPAAAGLFGKAVAMSANAYDRVWALTTLEDAQAAAAAQLGTYTLADLRAMSSEEVQDLTATYNPSGMVLDGTVITQSLSQAFASGTYNQVDMLWGCVTEDRGLFGILTLPDDDGNPFTAVNSVTPENLKKTLADDFGDQADACLSLYPFDMSKEDVIDVAKRINLDGMISGYYVATQAKNAGDSAHKTWIYHFAHVVPDTAERMAMHGAFHTADVGYWLNHFTVSAYPRPWTQADYQLGDTMSSYLVNFASTGDPNGDGLPQWDDVASTTHVSYLNLDSTTEMVAMDTAKADFWQSVLYK